MNFLEQRHQAEWSPLHRGLFHRLVAALRDKLDGREEALMLALQETEERAQECGEFLAAGLRLHACAALALARAADGAELEVPGHAGSCDGTEVLVAVELAAAAGRPDLAPGVAVRHQAGFPLALIPQNGGLDSSHQPASPGEAAEARPCDIRRLILERVELPAAPRERIFPAPLAALTLADADWTGALHNAVKAAGWPGARGGLPEREGLAWRVCDGDGAAIEIPALTGGSGGVTAWLALRQLGGRLPGQGRWWRVLPHFLRPAGPDFWSRVLGAAALDDAGRLLPVENVKAKLRAAAECKAPRLRLIAAAACQQEAWQEAGVSRRGRCGHLRVLFARDTRELARRLRRFCLRRAALRIALWSAVLLLPVLLYAGFKWWEKQPRWRNIEDFSGEAYPGDPRPWANKDETKGVERSIIGREEIIGGVKHHPMEWPNPRITVVSPRDGSPRDGLTQREGEKTFLLNRLGIPKPGEKSEWSSVGAWFKLKEKFGVMHAVELEVTGMNLAPGPRVRKPYLELLLSVGEEDEQPVESHVFWGDKTDKSAPGSVMPLENGTLRYELQTPRHIKKVQVVFGWIMPGDSITLDDLHAACTEGSGDRWSPRSTSPPLLNWMFTTGNRLFGGPEK